MVDKDNKPIPIPRMCETDPDGVIYIGRSGYKTQQTDRSLGIRIWEFAQERHSGAETYYLAKWGCNCFQRGPYEGHKLQYRVRHVPSGTQKAVDDAEIEALAVYFTQYGELPPCNSNFPKKWDKFYTTLRELQRSGYS